MHSPPGSPPIVDADPMAGPADAPVVADDDARPWLAAPVAPVPVALARLWRDRRDPGHLPEAARRLPSSPVEHGITVVTPAHLAREHLGACLASLVRQSLDRGAFEVVVVHNGPDDGSAALVEDHRRRSPQLQLRDLRSDRVGAGAARNRGLVAARYDHVTFVDADDTVSPGFLAGLREAAGPGIVAVADVRDVPEGGGPPAPSYASADLARNRDRPASLDDLHIVASYNAAKLLPTEAARLVGYDEELAVSEDVVFMTTVLTHLKPRLRVASPDAVYLRSVRSDSLSRARRADDVVIRQRLAVVERLHALLSAVDADVAFVVERKLATQCRAVGDVVEADPGLRASLVAELRQRPVSAFARSQVNRQLSTVPAITAAELAPMAAP